MIEKLAKQLISELRTSLWILFKTIGNMLFKEDPYGVFWVTILGLILKIVNMYTVTNLGTEFTSLISS